MPSKKPARPSAKKQSSGGVKKPRAKPVSLYGMDFDDVIRRLVSKTAQRKGSP